VSLYIVLSLLSAAPNSADRGDARVQTSYVKKEVVAITGPQYQPQKGCWFKHGMQLQNKQNLKRYLRIRNDEYVRKHVFLSSFRREAEIFDYVMNFYHNNRRKNHILI
jgi:hypothetical protein